MLEASLVSVFSGKVRGKARFKVRIKARFRPSFKAKASWGLRVSFKARFRGQL